ncbi:MAG: hydrolase [Candidatus Kapaibacterium sp.]
MRILANETIALCIDIQSKLFPHIHDNQRLEKNARTLIQGISTLSIPIVVTEQYVKGLGETIESVKEVLPSYSPLEKKCFSCADDEVIFNTIGGYNCKNIIMFGIESHVCVLQTCIDIIERGFTPVVVEDCIGSRKLYDNYVAIERMKKEGAIIATYESILFELCRVSGAETFKTISALVK